MKSLGNNQFEITNKKTGQTKVVTGEELPKYGLSKPEPQRNILQKIGDFVAPQTTKRVEEFIQNPSELKSFLPTNVMPGTLNLPNKETMKNVPMLKEIEQYIFMDKIAAPILEKLFGGLKFGGKTLTTFTKSRAAKATEKAAEKATEAGKVTLRGTFGGEEGLLSKLENMVVEKIGGKAEKSQTRKLVRKVLEDLQPESMQDVSAVNPMQLLDARRQLLAKYGTKNLLQSLFQKTTPEEQVAKIVRGGLSQELHSLAPETITPDKIYKLFASNKFGIPGTSGDIPQTIAKGALLPLLYKLVQSGITKPISSSLTEGY